MSFVGLNMIAVALKDDNNNVITDSNSGLTTTNSKYPGVFILNLSTAAGVTKANITNWQGSPKKVYGSNAVASVMLPAPEPSVSLGANDIPLDIIAKLTGMAVNSDGSFTRTATGKPVKGALLIGSQSFNGEQRFIGFYSGTFSLANSSLGTNTSSPKIVEDDLTFTSIGVDVGQEAATTTTNVADTKTITTTTGNNVKVYSLFDGANSSFNYDKMMNEIFPHASAGTSSSTVSTITADK